MAILRDIKNRIKGVKNTQQITKAMKMVSAAKLRKATDNIINARPYARKIGGLLNNLMMQDDYSDNLYIQEKDVKIVCVVVVTADRGLCGAFNTNIIRETNEYINNELIPSDIKPVLYCVGKKGYDFFKRNNATIIGSKTGLFSTLHFDSALEIYKNVVGGYLNGNYDKIVFIYNEFKSIVQQRLVKEQFLPVPAAEETGTDSLASIDFIFEPDKNTIVENLLPKHLHAQLWRILLESNAAEFASRMRAMDMATENAKEMIRTLNLKYNRLRQSQITKEILEVVSGANALRSAE